MSEEENINEEVGQDVVSYNLGGGADISLPEIPMPSTEKKKEVMRIKRVIQAAFTKTYEEGTRGYYAAIKKEGFIMKTHDWGSQIQFYINVFSNLTTHLRPQHPLFL